MSAAEPEEAFLSMLSTTDHLQEKEIGKKLERKCLRIISPVSPARLYCCYAVIIVLTGAVIALSVVLSLSVEKRQEQVSIKTAYAACPRNWIGFGSKCFYFSEDTNTWTFSQNSCMELEAQLAQFDNIEELIERLKMKHEEGSHPLQMETLGTHDCVSFSYGNTSDWSPVTF
ncbi:C-type lectin domain family 2 member D11-like [Alexandromys fortis]|uniref:C-type lectin domain family 2 member D11-like n=1 Tax=Alexandromys fortis TaxID=100897 RepID=UPI00215379C5|nr:C-type lectin domain family 2 member D11-like [Microtus fortis]